MKVTKHGELSQDRDYVMNNHAYDLDNQLNGPIDKPPVTGFVIVTFPFDINYYEQMLLNEPREGTPEHLHWQEKMEWKFKHGIEFIGNSERAALTLAFKLLVERWQQRGEWEFQA